MSGHAQNLALTRISSWNYSLVKCVDDGSVKTEPANVDLSYFESALLRSNANKAREVALELVGWDFGMPHKFPLGCTYIAQRRGAMEEA